MEKMPESNRIAREQKAKELERMRALRLAIRKEVLGR